MQRTIKLKLNTTPEQIQTLKQTLAGFTHAFNLVCKYGWDNSQKNGVKLHHATYYSLKQECPQLVSDLIIQARMKATEALKSVFALKKSYPQRLKKYETTKAKTLAKGQAFHKKPPRPPAALALSFVRPVTISILTSSIGPAKPLIWQLAPAIA